LNLVSDPESPYYRSAAFERLLNYVQYHPRDCQLRESGKKRSVIIRNIRTVEAAIAVFEGMVKIDEMNEKNLSMSR
jgi:transcription-repair coupling factor (superfamily II helicase)